jgi:hypothetical protein
MSCGEEFSGRGESLFYRGFLQETVFQNVVFDGQVVVRCVVNMVRKMT